MLLVLLIAGSVLSLSDHDYNHTANATANDTAPIVWGNSTAAYNTTTTFQKKLALMAENQMLHSQRRLSTGELGDLRRQLDTCHPAADPKFHDPDTPWKAHNVELACCVWPRWSLRTVLSCQYTCTCCTGCSRG